MPPDKREAPPGGSGASLFDVVSGNSDGSDTNLEIAVSQLRPRQIGPGELASLRAIWWRQASTGHRLPAEIDVIVIAGGLLW